MCETYVDGEGNTRVAPCNSIVVDGKIVVAGEILVPFVEPIVEEIEEENTEGGV